MTRLRSSTSSSSSLHTFQKRFDDWSGQQWAAFGGVLGGVAIIIAIGIWITFYRNRRNKQHKHKLRHSHPRGQGKYAKLDDEKTLIGNGDGHHSSKDNFELIESRRNSSVSHYVEARRDYDLEAQHNDSDSKPLIPGAKVGYHYQEQPIIIAPQPVARSIPLEDLTHKIATSQPPVYDHYLTDTVSRHSSPEPVLSRSSSMLQGRVDQNERGRQALSVAEQYGGDRRSLSVGR